MTLYEQAKQADDAWHAALVAVYGPAKAIEARYEMSGPKGSAPRGTATPELAALYQAFRAASDALWAAAPQRRHPKAAFFNAASEV